VPVEPALPVEELKAVLNQYPNAEDFARVPEEPANQGTKP